MDNASFMALHDYGEVWDKAAMPGQTFRTPPHLLFRARLKRGWNRFSNRPQYTGATRRNFPDDRIPNARHRAHRLVASPPQPSWMQVTGQ